LKLDNNWWRQAVVYQVYPRTFLDSNNDGMGDLRGITSKVDYLSKLGVDAIWLSPFYPSHLYDGGYDVDDYRNVDPRIGSLEDFDEMVKAFHAANIKIIVDIVPNHSSIHHEWFQEAINSPKGSAARDRYIFLDGEGDNPPNTWPSHFGPTCWTQTPDGQWYLHLFAPEQPDFNWKNADVRADFEKTIRFWADRGVDGFRVDVAHSLAKEIAPPYPDYPNYTPESIPVDGSHQLFDRDELMEIYKDWRKVFNSYDPPKFAVAEANAPVERRGRYAKEETLGQAFSFELLETAWDAEKYLKVITTSLKFAELNKSTTTWTLSNHDQVRHVSKFGLPAGTKYNDWLLSNGTKPVANYELGVQRARAATLLILGLPGCTYLYQGEELALPEVPDLPESELADPIWKRTSGKEKGRDGCRVSIPWSEATAHKNFKGLSAEIQENPTESMLNYYRKAIAMRKELCVNEEIEFVDAPKGVIGFKRGVNWSVFTNFNETPVALPSGKVLISSAPIANGQIPASATVWLSN
jgi:alpha-glucosidase